MSKTGQLFGLLFLALVAYPAEATLAASTGQLSTRSQASIGIGASVLPKFAIHEGAGALEVTSNAPTFRYNLVISSTADNLPGLSDDAPSRDGQTVVAKSPDARRQELLVLVVPD